MQLVLVLHEYLRCGAQATTAGAAEHVRVRPGLEQARLSLTTGSSSPAGVDSVHLLHPRRPAHSLTFDRTLTGRAGATIMV